LDAWLQRVWYGQSIAVWLSALLLAPLSLVFWIVSSLRRWAYRCGLVKGTRVSKPVIVVGNISVGGTGKTPFVIWLVTQLQQLGHTPAVITRGYGGTSSSWPVRVTTQSNPQTVGDEAVLIAQRTQAIVIAGPDRVADAQDAIAQGASVIVSDDGLQHYRLLRDVEIVVVDGERAFGNGWVLPAGPLRETRGRLAAVDAVVATLRTKSAMHAAIAQYQPILCSASLSGAKNLVTGEQRSLNSFAGQSVNAIAGIGNPNAFFGGLRAAGLLVNGRPLPDHVAITANDLRFHDALPVFMTEKDAVKCAAFAESKMWVVPQQFLVTGAESLLAKIESFLGTR
jgi:tetraacyldisaccharide 4'-kinase